MEVKIKGLVTLKPDTTIPKSLVGWSKVDGSIVIISKLESSHLFYAVRLMKIRIFKEIDGIDKKLRLRVEIQKNKEQDTILNIDTSTSNYMFYTVIHDNTNHPFIKKYIALEQECRRRGINPTLIKSDSFIRRGEVMW